jgi:hypothetical protein
MKTDYRRNRSGQSTPAGAFALHVQDVILHLKRKLVGIAIGTAAAIGKPFKTALLITIEDLVPGLSGDTELPAKFRHWLAG